MYQFIFKFVREEREGKKKFLVLLIGAQVRILNNSALEIPLLLRKRKILFPTSCRDLGIIPSRPKILQKKPIPSLLYDFVRNKSWLCVSQRRAKSKKNMKKGKERGRVGNENKRDVEESDKSTVLSDLRRVFRGKRKRL